MEVRAQQHQKMFNNRDESCEIDDIRRGNRETGSAHKNGAVTVAAKVFPFAKTTWEARELNEYATTTTTAPASIK